MSKQKVQKSNTVIHFLDPNFEAAVHIEINKPESEIMQLRDLRTYS